MEEESGTFCFVEGGRGESEQLLIFGHDKFDRDVAERLINNLINEKLRDFYVEALQPRRIKYAPAAIGPRRPGLAGLLASLVPVARRASRALRASLL